MDLKQLQTKLELLEKDLEEDLKDCNQEYFDLGQEIKEAGECCNGSKKELLALTKHYISLKEEYDIYDENDEIERLYGYWKDDSLNDDEMNLSHFWKE